jgi:hypothetical protein
MNGNFPDWQEWRDLPQDAREYELYRTLSYIHAETEKIGSACSARVDQCAAKFRCIENEFSAVDKKIEKKKFFDRTTAAVAGTIGGALAYIATRFGGQ